MMPVFIKEALSCQLLAFSWIVTEVSDRGLQARSAINAKHFRINDGVEITQTRGSVCESIRAKIQAKSKKLQAACGEINHHQSQQQHRAFNACRPHMQHVELNTLWIVDGRGTHITQRCPQSIHARNDDELRNQRQRQHQAEKNMACRKHMCSPVSQATVE